MHGWMGESTGSLDPVLSIQGRESSRARGPGFFFGTEWAIRPRLEFHRDGWISGTIAG